MAHNLPETRRRGADYEPYFPGEQALTSLLPLPNDPTTYLAIPDCSATAACNQLERKIRRRVSPYFQSEGTEEKVCRK
jgi:hypothetical protein